MSQSPAPGRPVLVVTADAALLARVRQTLFDLPLDAPGLPDPPEPTHTWTDDEARRLIGEARRDHAPFGMVITDSMAAAEVAWAEDTGLPVLYVGTPDPIALTNAPPARLLLLPDTPHPLLLQQAILFAAGRAGDVAEQEALQARTEAAEAERDALMAGSAEAMEALLAAMDSTLAERSRRIANLATHTASTLGLESPENLILAARMSLLGLTGLSESDRALQHCGKPLSDRQERTRRMHPRVGEKILRRMPGTDGAADLIALQAPDRSGVPLTLNPRKQIEATILRLAMEIDALVCAGLVPITAAEELAANPPPSLRAAVKDPALMDAVHAACLKERAVSIEDLRVGRLKPGMILYADVLTSRGALLVARNQEITPMLLQRLKRFANGVGIKEPVRVLVPARPVRQRRAG